MLTDGLLNAALLGIIEEAARAMVTLTADIEEAAFVNSRLTLPAVRRHLLTVAETAANLPVATRVNMERIDWDAWATAAREAGEGRPGAGAVLWFAARSLAPATLLWLAAYRKQQPALFAYRA